MKIMQLEFNICDLGMIEYRDAYAIQMEHVQRVRDGEPPVVIVCEHPTVITMGRMAKKGHLLFSEAALKKDGVTVEYIDRGGDITLHAPGQLVIYPILDLNLFGKDLHLYLRRLEGVVIALFDQFGLKGRREEGKTGVWVADKKVVSMGIGVKRWVTFHGIGINVSTDLQLFRMIQPCGLNVEMTSISHIIGRKIIMEQVKNKFLQEFQREFDINKGVGNV